MPRLRRGTKEGKTMTDLKRFEYVLALAEHMNFSQAAAKLNISQSSLSQYIQKVEKELGVFLFDRSTSTLTLTQYGRIYIQGARRILDIYTEIQDSISDADAGAAGSLQVGISPSRAPFLLPHVVSRFRALYPNVTLRFVETKSRDILKNIDEGSIDFAYTIASKLERPGDYRIFPMDTEEIMLVCAQENGPRIEAEGGCVDFRSLKDLPFVALADDQLLTNDFYQLCKKCGTAPEVAVSVSELSTAIAIVKSGYGVMLLPSSYRSYGDLSRTLSFYSIQQGASQRDLAVILRKEKYLNKPAKALIGILSDPDV